MTPRASKLFIDWHAGQGAKIKGARPMAVYAQCLMLAKDMAKAADGHVGRVLLLTEQIDLCERRALSQARLARFGAPPQTEEEWQHQLAQIRADWANPEPKAKAAA